VFTNEQGTHLYLAWELGPQNSGEDPWFPVGALRVQSTPFALSQTLVADDGVGIARVGRGDRYRASAGFSSPMLRPFQFTDRIDAAVSASNAATGASVGSGDVLAAIQAAAVANTQIAWFLRKWQAAEANGWIDLSDPVTVAAFGALSTLGMPGLDATFVGSLLLF
jgi:hypothetical protein